MIFWFYQKYKISMDYPFSKNKANKSSISFYANKNNYNDYFYNIKDNNNINQAFINKININSLSKNLTLRSEKQKRIMIKASEDAGLFNWAKDKVIYPNYILTGKTFTIGHLGGGRGDNETDNKTLNNLIINKIFGF